MLKRQSGFSDVNVGLLGALPYLAAFVAMQVNGWHSDKSHERRWHSAAPFSDRGGRTCWGWSLLGTTPVHCVLARVVHDGGHGGHRLSAGFWAIPTEILGQSAAAAAVGMINAVGSVAGFAGPYLFGYLNTRTGSLSYGLAVMMASALAGALLMLCTPRSARAVVR